MRLTFARLRGGMLVASFVAALAASVLREGRTTSEQDNALADLVRQASMGRARLIRSWPGEHGLTGLAVKGQDDASPEEIVWATADKRALVVGQLLDANGRDLSVLASQKRGMPSPAANSVDEFLARARLGRAVLQHAQADAATLYIYFETTCSYCRRLHRQIEEMREEFFVHKIQVAWLPVAIQPSARSGGALILERGLDALVSLPLGRDFEPTPQSLAAVDENSLLFLKRSPKAATPVLLYQGRGGAEVVVGLPRPDELRQILLSLTTREIPDF